MSSKEIAQDPTIADVVYVQENYYYTNASGETVNVYPDYVTKTITSTIEKDKDGKYLGVRYYYSDPTLSEPIQVQRSLSDPVYRYKTSQGNMYEATLSVTASGLRVSFNGELLDYSIADTGIGDDGQEKYESITATDNFRRLHMKLLSFSLFK